VEWQSPGCEFEMWPRLQSLECLEAARAAGLTGVRLGNIHLLRD